MSHQAFRAAVEKAKGQSAFARAVGTTQQNVSNWLAAGKPLPAEYVLPAERAGFGLRTDLRPDIYPSDDINGGSNTATEMSGSCDKSDNPITRVAA